MSSVIKLCANHLRAFSNNHGVKLKSGHAHELLAAFFGYKSRAAMLEDNVFPIKNLNQAHIFVLMPMPFIEDRRECLEDLPTDLPDTNTLGDEILACLSSGGGAADRYFKSWANLSEILTSEYLKLHGDLILPPIFRFNEKEREIFKTPLYEFNPQIVITGGRVELIVGNKYQTRNDLRFQGSTEIWFSIKLQRIAGHVGYSGAEVTVIDGSLQSLSQTGGI